MIPHPPIPSRTAAPTGPTTVRQLTPLRAPCRYHRKRRTPRWRTQPYRPGTETPLPVPLSYGHAQFSPGTHLPAPPSPAQRDPGTAPITLDIESYPQYVTVPAPGRMQADRAADTPPTHTTRNCRAP